MHDCGDSGRDVGECEDTSAAKDHGEKITTEAASNSYHLEIWARTAKLASLVHPLSTPRTRGGRV